MVVKAEDKKHQVSERRCKELNEARKRIRVEDRRTWAALKREYTMAEQLATNDFKWTVLFEPFAGSFATTRVASAEFGWTCSQPLDLLDGYDLLSKSGIQMLWDVLRQHRPVFILIAFDCRIWSLLTNCNPGTDWELLRSTLGKKTLDLIAQLCIWQDQHGAYYLLENPAGSLAWVYEGILARLLVEAHGKYATGDQCCFGKKDADTGKPVRKATGWLCNSEHILNPDRQEVSVPFWKPSERGWQQQFGAQIEAGGHVP